MPLINCKINFILTWYSNCAISPNTAAHYGPIFSITDTKVCAPVVTLSTEDNANLLQQLQSGFKRRINWNKY